MEYRCGHGTAGPDGSDGSWGGHGGGHGDSQPDFGANVKIFDPSMPTSEIQATVDAIAAQQIGNQFGPERYALLFKPGTYGTAAAPLNFQVGYYTSVAGLGLSPNDVVINGSVYVRNQCETKPDRRSCTALNNFWRSLSNLTHQRHHPRRGLLHRRVLGRVAGRADAPGARQRADHADGLLHRAVLRQRRIHRGLAVRRPR